MTHGTIDPTRVEAFAERMIGALNGAGVTFLTSVAYRTGLFETMAKLPPSTSEDIARAAALQERCVRECLGGLVVGKVSTMNRPRRRTACRPNTPRA